MKSATFSRFSKTTSAIAVAALGLAVAAAQHPVHAQLANASNRTVDEPKGKHQDHEAKHGGIFFMAMDQEHHLEGVFMPPGVFRVYLYNAYTKPLSKDKVKDANGTVQVGDSPDAPKMPLTLSKDGKTLEIPLPNVKFPFTLTLLMHFPDTPADARPELFTLPFAKYTNPNDHPPSTMPGMRM